MKAELDQMPGISIYNSLEYNFITRFDACYEPIVVARGVDYTTGIQAEVAKLRGVSVISEPVRAYQNSAYFSHLLGYVGPISRRMSTTRTKRHTGRTTRWGRWGLRPRWRIN